jgi:hypothetical protein
MTHGGGGGCAAASGATAIEAAAAAPTKSMGVIFVSFAIIGFDYHVGEIIKP